MATNGKKLKRAHKQMTKPGESLRAFAMRMDGSGLDVAAAAWGWLNAKYPARAKARAQVSR